MSACNNTLLYTIIGLAVVSMYRDNHWKNKQDKAIQAQAAQLNTLEQKLNQILQIEKVNSKKLDRIGKTQVKQTDSLVIMHGEIHEIYWQECDPINPEAEPVSRK